MAEAVLPKEYLALNDKQRAFVRAYVECLNATKAAKTAGYSAATAAQQASRMMADPRIRAAKDKLIQGSGMSRNELLARLEFIAQDSTALELTVTTRKVKRMVGKGENAKEIEETVTSPDLEAALKSGVLRSARKVKIDRFGAVSIEMHDPQRAMELTAKIKGWLGDSGDETDGDEALEVEQAMTEGEFAIEASLDD